MPPSHYSSVITPSCHHRPRGGSIHPARSSCALYQMDIPLSACVPERTGPFLLPETLDIIIGLFCYEFRENARVSPAFRLVIHNFHHLPVIQERFGKMMDEQNKFYLYDENEENFVPDRDSLYVTYRYRMATIPLFFPSLQSRMNEIKR